MKSFTLGLGLVMALGLFGVGCGSDPEEDSAPPETAVTRVASSLERKLTAPIAIPTDTPVGGTMDALVEAQSANLTAVDPVVNLGANGMRCTILRFNDDKGVEQMRREKCDKVSDTLHLGKVVYTDQNVDGKIDQLQDFTGAVDDSATYELDDTDFDGKIDRMVESAQHMSKPVSLTDFGVHVTIAAGGKIASRMREDKDHDGKFDMESVTATTSFRITN